MGMLWPLNHKEAMVIITNVRNLITAGILTREFLTNLVANVNLLKGVSTAIPPHMELICVSNCKREVRALGEASLFKSKAIHPMVVNNLTLEHSRC